MTYGLELAGDNATWYFETGRIRIVYRGGLRANGLLKRMGERIVPDTAMAGATVTGDRKTAVLRLQLRPGACPYLTAAAGQLPERGDPYRLVLAAANRDLAEHYAEDIRLRVSLNPEAEQPAPVFLLDAPAPPLRIKGWDSEVGFDGRQVRFEPKYDDAEPEKVAAGPQHIPIGTVLGLEWVTPADGEGHLRLRTTEAPQFTLEPDVDPLAVTFGMGYGTTADTLPFAAAILAAVGTATPPEPPAEPAALPAAPAEPAANAGPAAPAQPVANAGPAASAEPAPPAAPAASPDQVIEAIRKLGELRDLGLLTEEEFTAKKTELLGRL